MSSAQKLETRASMHPEAISRVHGEEVCLFQRQNLNYVYEADLSRSPFPFLEVLFSPPPLSLQKTETDKMTQLPVELLNSIMQMVCADSSAAVVNQSLLALRCCSKSFAAASNSARACITLHPAHLANAAPLFSKQTSLTAITICCPPDLTPHPSDTSTTTTHIPLRLSSSDLRLVSTNTPTLVSLTLTHGGNTRLHLLAASLTQLPWWDRLQHLTLHHCTLLTSAVVQHHIAPIELESWSPELPNLTSLVMTYGLLTSLDLAGCPHLQEVTLECNTLLACLRLSNATSLCWFLSLQSHRLTTLDLSGCCNLHTLRLDGSLSLASLVLTGCVALRGLDCSGTACLASICLDNCTSLEHLRIDTNWELMGLDLTHCCALLTIECYGNLSLHGLDLSHNHKLQSLALILNQVFTALDLSGCCALQTLTFCKNDSLHGLDCSELGALEQVVSTKNSILTYMSFKNCRVLQMVHFKGNEALLDVNMSGCAALHMLTCIDNHSLMSLRLSDCGSLEHLEMSGCEKLGEVDLSSCPFLAPGET